MEQKQILALGFFDGVHAGHGALLRRCRELADRMGCRAGAVTFEPHPDALVLGKAPDLINTSTDRNRLMQEEFRMDRVITLPFDQKMMRMPWQDFFRLLREQYQAAGLVCGHNFRFGSRGEGNGEKLTAACRDAGMPCIVVEAQLVDGEEVSSTRIRQLLEQGQMERAVRCLGHPHVLTGRVVPGKQLGRTIGIPTANLLLPEELVIPRFGVYACLASVNGRKYPAVTNIGTRPTVNGTGITVEPWLLDFEGDLYGRELKLEFYKFLRPERKFPSLEALQAEIRKNGAEVRDFFEKT